MQVVVRHILECTLEELWLAYWANQPDLGETLGDVEKEMRGESKPKPRFRIPATDNGIDIFFDNQELFLRYAGMPTPTQTHFLIAIRLAMKDRGSSRVEIRIPWNANGFKTLNVRASSLGPVGSLDFELLR